MIEGSSAGIRERVSVGVEGRVELVLVVLKSLRDWDDGRARHNRQELMRGHYVVRFCFFAVKGEGKRVGICQGLGVEEGGEREREREREKRSFAVGGERSQNKRTSRGSE